MPIDYLRYQQSVQSPLSRALEGYRIGNEIKQQNIQNEQVRLKQENAKAMRDDLVKLSQKPDATASDYASMMAKYPEIGEHLSSTWSVLDSGQKAVKQKQMVEVLTALESGNVDIAEQLIESSMKAAENSGDLDLSKGQEALLESIRTDPKGAKVGVMLGLANSMGPERFSDTLKSIQSTLQEQSLLPGKIEAQGLDLGLTKAQTMKTLVDAKKLGFDTQKLVLEIESAKKGNAIIEPTKKFDLEAKLRSEYSKETSGFQAVQDAYRRLEASQDTAAGDLSLIFSYMKMLDPGSVVREGEFATAQNATGVPERIVNLYNNLLSGERLNANQRKSFKSQSASLFNAAKKREGEVRKGIERIVSNYSLNKDNVFLTENSPPMADETTETGSFEQPSYMKYANP